jgi:uncharacterized protein (UPF0297 family)
MGKDNTQFFQVVKEQEYDVASILRDVYAALKEKGYNPVYQIVGYIISGDPTYITSYQNARSLIMKVERDEILDVLFENYIDTVLEKKSEAE